MKTNYKNIGTKRHRCCNCRKMRVEKNMIPLHTDSGNHRDMQWICLDNDNCITENQYWIQRKINHIN